MITVVFMVAVTSSEEPTLRACHGSEGRPRRIAVLPDGREIFVGNLNSTQVLAPRVVRRIWSGSNDLAFLPDGSRVYLFRAVSTKVIVIDGSTCANLANRQ